MADGKTVPLSSDTKTYTFNNLKPGTRIYVCIVSTISYNNGNVQDMHETATIATLPGQITSRNQTKWFRIANSLSVGWDKQPGAKPYRGSTSLGLDLKISDGKLTVSWEKVNGLSGYNVYVTDKKYGKFTKDKKSLKASTTKVTIKKVVLALITSHTQVTIVAVPEIMLFTRIPGMLRDNK